MMRTGKIVSYFQPLVTIFICRNCPRRDSQYSTSLTQIGLSSDRLAKAVIELIGVELDIAVRRVECLASCFHPIAVLLRTGGSQRQLLLDTKDDGAPMVVKLARTVLPHNDRP